MPIKEPQELREYAPTEKERMIAEKVRASTQDGIAYSEIKKSTELSDTALSKFLRRMQHYGLIIRDERRRYHITTVGVQFLMSINPTQISKDQLRAHRKKEASILWREAHRIQERVFQLWRLYADETSKLLFTAGSAGHPDLLYIGALKDAKGREILMMKTPDLRELKRLGYDFEKRKPTG